MNQSLDAIDNKLLNIIQADFPLAPRPYLELAQRIGISETEAFARISALRKKGIIRRLGANFQSRQLGFFSTLCAAKVPSDKLESFIGAVNAIPGVTHNYEREHEYNIWFTLICESAESARATLNSLSDHTGIEILNLPAERLYKIRVDFPME